VLVWFLFRLCADAAAPLVQVGARTLFSWADYGQNVNTVENIVACWCCVASHTALQLQSLPAGFLARPCSMVAVHQEPADEGAMDEALE
jgi:hypothetical protein